MKGLYSAEDKRFKCLNDVWDVCSFKLMVFIVEAKDLPNVGPKSQVSCSVRLERRTFGKTAAQASAEPKWVSLFWTAFDDPGIHTLVFEVFDKKTVLGEVRVSLNKAPKDSLVDAWIPLKASTEGKKKNDAQGGGGHLHVRYVLSTIAETRPAKPSDMVPQEYFYRKNNIVFQAGDLIAFSGTGLLQTVQKVVSNSEHSHVGLVVALPNKWTGEEEMFLLELTFNLDNNIDAFAETARKGLCLFRLKERLHNFHGGLITHYPLLRPLEGIPKADLGQTVLRVHGQETVPSVPNSAGTQFILRTFPFDTKRNLREFVPLTGVKFIAQALAHIALLKEDQLPAPAEQTVDWLKRQPIWNRPNLVRMPQEALKTVMATMGRNTGKKLAEQSAAPQHNFPVVQPPQFQQQPPVPQFAASAPPQQYAAAPLQYAPVQQQQQQQQFASQSARMSGQFAPQQYPMPAPAAMSFPVVPPPNFSASGSGSRRSSMAAPVATDPKIAAMEAEMRRLEAEAAAQQRMMDEQARKLEADQRALEAAMLASEAQMKQLQAGLNGGGGDDGNSDEGDDDGSASANAQLLALSSAGFNYNFAQ